MNSLSLTYRPEDKSHGELSAVVESDEFRGRGAAWFPVESLRDFALSVGAYPIVEGQEPSLAGGFWDDTGERLEQCHLGVQLAPHDRRGAIRVTVTLGTPSQNGDHADLHQELTARFLTTYAEIDQFRDAFTAMMEGQADTATLTGRRT